MLTLLILDELRDEETWVTLSGELEETLAAMVASYPSDQYSVFVLEDTILTPYEEYDYGTET